MNLTFFTSINFIVLWNKGLSHSVIKLNTSIVVKLQYKKYQDKKCQYMIKSCHPINEKVLIKYKDKTCLILYFSYWTLPYLAHTQC